MLATTAKSTTPLYKSLAMRFRQRMHFAEVHSDIVASLDGLEVEAFPQLSVTTAAGERHIYDGELQVLIKDRGCRLLSLNSNPFISVAAPTIPQAQFVSMPARAQIAFLHLSVSLCHLPA